MNFVFVFTVLYFIQLIGTTNISVKLFRDNRDKNCHFKKITKNLFEHIKNFMEKFCCKNLGFVLVVRMSWTRSANAQFSNDIVSQFLLFFAMYCHLSFFVLFQKTNLPQGLHMKLRICNLYYIGRNIILFFEQLWGIFVF